MTRDMARCHVSTEMMETINSNTKILEYPFNQSSEDRICEPKNIWLIVYTITRSTCSVVNVAHKYVIFSAKNNKHVQLFYLDI